MGVHLIVQYYKDEKRQEEIDKVLAININNPEIDFIHLLQENSDTPSVRLNSKVIITVIENRLTWKMCLHYVRTFIPNDEIVIIANADIAFDSSIEIVKRENLKGKVFSLLRYEILPNKQLELFGTDRSHPLYHPSILHGGSQDSWIFETPLPEITESTDFCMGVNLCDSKINWVFSQAGLKVSNPCLSIRTIHYHKSTTRNRSSYELPPPYVTPSPYSLSLAPYL